MKERLQSILAVLIAIPVFSLFAVCLLAAGILGVTHARRTL